MTRDFYETLGVARDADADAIKKAYRRKAMEYHPDRNAGDDAAERAFKEVNAAYEILKDERKRAAYDRFGHAAFERGGGPQAGGFDFRGGFADIFDEMFGDFARGGRPQQANRRGSDLRYNMEISLEDAFRGREARIRVPTAVACSDCRGSGAESGRAPVTCGACGGAGRVRAQQGLFAVETTCVACHGGGRVIEDPCRACAGAGRVARERTLSVKIPPGVDDGTRIRLSGKGEAGMRGGPTGDLYVFLHMKPHEIFQRDGADIYCAVPLPMTTAALGGAIEVPAVDGSRARVNIPSGTQTGSRFRLRDKGMPVLHARRRGDMYIEAQVETPVRLSKRQQELLREFDGAGRKPGGNSPRSQGFFDRVRELWDELRE